MKKNEEKRTQVNEKERTKKNPATPILTNADSNRRTQASILTDEPSNTDEQTKNPGADSPNSDEPQQHRRAVEGLICFGDFFMGFWGLEVETQVHFGEERKNTKKLFIFLKIPTYYTNR